MAYKAYKSWCRALGVRISRQSGMCRRCAEEAQVVESTVTTAIDDLGELADPDF